jgi:hypothetical protein
LTIEDLWYRFALSFLLKSIELLVSVQGFKGSGAQGCILVPGLHVGCVFTRKASALSGLIQNLEPPKGQLFEEMSIFNENFGPLMPNFVLNPLAQT